MEEAGIHGRWLRWDEGEEQENTNPIHFPTTHGLLAGSAGDTKTLSDVRNVVNNLIMFANNYYICLMKIKGNVNPWMIRNCLFI